MTDTAMLAMAKRYLDLKQQAKAIETQLDDIESDIKAQLGEQEEKSLDGVQIKWKHYTSNRFDSAAFKADAPALYDKYQKTIAARRFTIT